MLLQKQTIFGPYGNCLAACVASLFGLPLDEVPNFNDWENDPAKGGWWNYLCVWSAHRGLLPVYFHVSHPGGVAKQEWYHWVKDAVVIAGGPSPRHPEPRFAHAVLYKDGNLIWDPHPDNTGISRVDDVTMFVVKEPWKLR